MNTATEHLKALLVDDGLEFAMVRKADLAALMAAIDAADLKGQDPWYVYLNNMGVLNREVEHLRASAKTLERGALHSARCAVKHGEERRRYMANNKVLLARVEQLERWNSEGERLALKGMAAAFKDQKVVRAVASAISKAPATCRMLGLIKCSI